MALNKKYYIFILYFIILAILIAECVADVTSVTGTINFDANNDNSHEMTLSVNGLGIGGTASANLHVQGNAYITEKLGIGTSNPLHTLDITGTFGMGVQTVSTNVTLSDNSIVLVDTSTSNIILKLPYAGNVSGRVYKIKKVTSLNTVWVTGGGNQIDGQNLVAMTTSDNGFPYLNVLSNGSDWYIMDQSGNISEIASDNLVAYWKMDETTGDTLTDSSTQSNHGTRSNFGTAGNGWVSGKIGNGLSFDGNDDSVTIGDISTYDFDGQSFSVAFWCYSAADHSGTILKKGTGTVRTGYHFSLVTGNEAELTYSDTFSSGDHRTKSTTDATPPNEWVHLTFVIDKVNNTGKGYANAVEVFSTDITGIVNNAAGNTLGISSDGSWRYNGVLDDFRMYNRALTAEEIGIFYEATK